MTMTPFLPEQHVQFIRNLDKVKSPQFPDILVSMMIYGTETR